MLYLLSYDVHNDKQRKEICNFLKDCGYHIQKSVFIVDCDCGLAQAIFNQVASLADLTTDRILMVPLCNQCFRKAKLQGNYVGFNEDVWIV